MQKPLRSADTQPRDLQFTHFGVLDVGGQNKASLVTAIGINGLLLAIAVIISAAAVKVAHDNRLKEVTYAVIPPVNRRSPQAEAHPAQADRQTSRRAAARRAEDRPAEDYAARRPQADHRDDAATAQAGRHPGHAEGRRGSRRAETRGRTPGPVGVGADHDAHPSAVSLGQTNSPIAPSNRPATASVNLGQQGMQGMPPGSGRGPNSTAVNLGSGQPSGSLGGTGVRGVQGVKLGVTGGTGTTPGNGIGTRPPTQVALGHAPAPPPATNTSLAHLPVRTGPQVIYKPRPQYTADATANKIEGLVSVRIRVSAGGEVSVLGVTSGLGHGLDESAVRAVQATRFRPAVDANGSPTDWEGVVNISFQMAG